MKSPQQQIISVLGMEWVMTACQWMLPVMRLGHGELWCYPELVLRQIDHIISWYLATSCASSREIDLYVQKNTVWDAQSYFYADTPCFYQSKRAIWCFTLLCCFNLKQLVVTGNTQTRAWCSTASFLRTKPLNNCSLSLLLYWRRLGNRERHGPAFALILWKHLAKRNITKPKRPNSELNRTNRLPSTEACNHLAW